MADGVGDLKMELVSLRNELVKLNRVVMPLTAITDLSLTIVGSDIKAVLEGEAELSPDL